MIHFTCDCCRQPIDAERENRYVVRMEVYTAIDLDDAGTEECDAERDHLQEIQHLLESTDDPDDIDEVYQQVRYDLCSDCCRQFKKNPLGRFSAVKLGFSKN